MSAFTPASSSMSHPSRPARLAGDPSPGTPSAGDVSLPRYWPTWAMLTVFIFIAFECALLAAALKGQWLILFAPAAVCGVKAWDAWKQLRRAANG
jgi:hypothetical protein